MLQKYLILGNLFKGCEFLLLLPVCQQTGSGRAVQALSPLMQSPQEAVSSLAQSEKLWQNPSSGKKVNHLQDGPMA